MNRDTLEFATFCVGSLANSLNISRSDIYSQEQHITMSQAADLFYASSTARMIEDGVADLHCRSDKYLVEELCLELQRQGKLTATPTPHPASQEIKQ